MNLLKKFNDNTNFLLSLGYSREEVIKMTKNYPAIYGYSIDNMKKKIEDMESLGYSREEVIKMTKTLPAIYSYSIDNMKQKIKFYDSINMHELAIEAPIYLMQSVVLSFAKYHFYLSRGIQIDMNNYKKLFVSNKRFEKQYGIKKEDLLKMFSYEKYMEEIKNDMEIKKDELTDMFNYEEYVEEIKNERVI